MKTSTNGRKLIAGFEGCVLTAYKCPAGVLTIGVGHTSAASAPAVKSGMKISANEADDILARDLSSFEAAVSRLVTSSLNQNQFDALVSLVFNIGARAFSSSTLLKKLNAGDYDGAAAQFERWNKASGRVLSGLTRRRAAERDLFVRPIAPFPGNSVADVPAPPFSSFSTDRPSILSALLATLKTAFSPKG